MIRFQQLHSKVSNPYGFIIWDSKGSRCNRGMSWDFNRTSTKTNFKLVLLLG
jgi:hypothetical protein